MKFIDACENGSNWAIRLSGNNLVIGKYEQAYIYTDAETIPIVGYRSEKFEDWMPLPKCPGHIPKIQNHEWHRVAHRKFKTEELNTQIANLENTIKGYK